MYKPKVEESPIQAMLDEMGRKLSVKMLAENERQKRQAANEKSSPQVRGPACLTLPKGIVQNNELEQLKHKLKESLESNNLLTEQLKASQDECNKLKHKISCNIN